MAGAAEERVVAARRRVGGRRVGFGKCQSLEDERRVSPERSSLPQISFSRGCVHLISSSFVVFTISALSLPVAVLAARSRPTAKVFNKSAMRTAAQTKAETICIS